MRKDPSKIVLLEVASQVAEYLQHAIEYGTHAIDESRPGHTAGELLIMLEAAIRLATREDEGGAA